MTPDLTIDEIYAQIAAVGQSLRRNLAEEMRWIKNDDRRLAEIKRSRMERLVRRCIETTPDNRIKAAKARAAAVHAQIDEHVAERDLRVIEAGAQADPPEDVADLPINDFDGLFQIRSHLPEWLCKRIETIQGKVTWHTRKGKKSYFNKACHDNDIPIDQALTILAHLHHIEDEKGNVTDWWTDSVIECGLYPKVSRGEFYYGKRCQDSEHCELCNYLNLSAGLKELLHGYSESAFHKGGGWFGFTVAPRIDRTLARAVGRTLSPDDWNKENPNSAVFAESHQSRAFEYAKPHEEEGMDWAVGSNIRCFLGAIQLAFGLLVKNGWLDGIRCKVENSIEFLPFKSHQHWHGVGSSRAEHDPQKMAEFIQAEVNRILARTAPGVYADVLVVSIPTPEDLQRWIKYINKTVDLLGAVQSVYNRHPRLRRTDPEFKDFSAELHLYRKRSRQVFGMIRSGVIDERGKHTYRLQRQYVRGNHKFGNGSILSESRRHRVYRKREAERMRAKNRKKTGKSPKRKQHAKNR